MVTPRPICLVLVPFLLTGCGYGASRTAHQAQITMIGMTGDDLQACVGAPDKTAKLNSATQVLTYEFRPAGPGGINVTLPLNLGGVTAGASGSYCRANFRLVNNRVSEVHYTGDNDRAIGNEGVCEPLIRGCMRQLEPTMQPVDATIRGRSSGYSSPPVPQQPPAAEQPDAQPVMKPAEGVVPPPHP
jgi:hypothetical protein